MDRKLPEPMTDILPEELECLKNHFIAKSPKMYLELGIWQGYTFEKIIQTRNQHNLNTRCYGLDVFDVLKLTANNTHTDILSNYDNARLRFDKYKRTYLLKAYSEDFLGMCEKYHLFFDFIFHDCNHRYPSVYADLVKCSFITESGDIIAVHNTSTNIHPDMSYIKIDGGPRKAVDKVVAEKRLEIIEEVQRLTIMRKL